MRQNRKKKAKNRSFVDTDKLLRKQAKNAQVELQKTKEREAKELLDSYNDNNDYPPWEK